MNEILQVLKDPQTQAMLRTQVVQHLVLSLTSVLLATLVAVPAGIWLTRHERLASPVLTVVSLVQTLPSIALLAFMIPFMGIGSAPAISALFLYALLPILRNTYTGIQGVDPAARESARGMGMTERQMLFMVELPLAFRVIMSGIRVSTVMIIGWATLAAFVGAGGVPVTLMALLADYGLGRLERAATPAGLRVSEGGH
jgi:osmoprotectant transport system permease protein